jgi:outer membrane protein assembly factor BamB
VPAAVAFITLSVALIGASCRRFEPAPAWRDRVLWRHPLAAPGGEESDWHGVPASDGRYAFIETDSGVMALDPADGRTVWANALWRARSPAADRIIHRDGTLFLADRAMVYALSAASGTLLWRQSFGADSLHQLTLLGGDDENVYVTQRFEPIITAARQRDGLVVWQRSVIPDSGFSSIVSGMARAGDTVYFGGARNRAANGYPKTLVIVGVAVATGSPVFQFEKTTPNTASSDDMVVQDSLIILGDFLQSSVLAINRFNRIKAWEFFGNPVYFGPDFGPVLVGDTAFIASNDLYVYAVNSRSGELFWRARTRASISRFALCGRFVIANNQAVALVDRGTHAVEGYYVSPTGDENDFPTSGFAVIGNRAVVTGWRSAFGIDCS